MNSLLPSSSVIGIGAPKCGTTYFERIFSQHPQVSFSKVLEPHFFSSTKYIRPGIEWYLQLFSKNKIPFDFSTKYLRHHQIVIPRIKESRLSDNLKIVCFLRDPIRRAYSNYMWLLQQSNSSPSYNLGIEQFCEIYPQLIEYSQYSHGLSSFINAFGQENILIIQSELFFANPQAILRQFEEYLGLEHFPTYDFTFSRSSTYVPRSRCLELIRKSCFQFANSSGLLGNKLLVKYISSASNLFKTVNSDSRNISHLEKMKPDVIGFFSGILTPEYKSLSLMNLGLDFNLWTSI